MSEPRTAAGRALDTEMYLKTGRDLSDAILAIEAEAAAPAGQAGLDPSLLNVESFIAGLDSPHHSPESRRAWVALFFRDMERAAAPAGLAEAEPVLLAAEAVDNAWHEEDGEVRHSDELWERLLDLRRAFLAPEAQPEEASS